MRSLGISSKAYAGCRLPVGLTNRWSQSLAVAMRTFDFVKEFLMFAALVHANGGSAPSR